MIRRVFMALSTVALVSTAAFSQQPQPARQPAPQQAQQPRQAAPQQQQQQQQEQPQIETTAFDNWVKRCSNQEAADNKAVRTCEVRSHLVIQDKETDKQVVAAVIVIARAVNSKTLQAIVQVPISARLDTTPKLFGSDNKPIAELPFIACQPMLCSAVINLTDAQIAAMKKIGDKVSVTYNNQVGQLIRIEGQAKGLGAALDALIKEK